MEHRSVIFSVVPTNDCLHDQINRLRWKNRRDFPWAVIPSRRDFGPKGGIYGLFSNKETAEKFATLMRVQERLEDVPEESK